MSATPLEVASGYAVFANGGHRIQPWFIERIEDPTGEVVFQATPRRVALECDPPDPMSRPNADGMAVPEVPIAPSPAETEGPSLVPAGCALPATEIAPRVISAQNAWLITDMLREVITRGTGRRALALGRSDIAGKTGTTNEARDTWFNGYNASVVATVWVGFDQSRPLGEGEEGSRTAVPIWVDFMAKALEGTPDRPWDMPGGFMQARISPVTGELAGADDPDAVFETFMVDRLPVGSSPGNPAADPRRPNGTPAEPIF